MTVPLREDPAGVLRVGDTRVLLELVVHAFQCGATPETIVQSYDTLSLADVYAVLAYCLTHREQIDEYMCRCDAEALDVRRRVQATQADQSGVRERPCWPHVPEQTDSPVTAGSAAAGSGVR